MKEVRRHPTTGEGEADEDGGGVAEDRPRREVVAEAGHGQQEGGRVDRPAQKGPGELAQGVSVGARGVDSMAS